MAPMTQAPAVPPFDPKATHQQVPKLRPVRAFPAQTQEGQTLLGLADSRQVSDELVYFAPAVQHILPLMDGARSLDAIAAEVGKGLTRGILEQIVAQLDHAGLLEGPGFQKRLEKMRRDFDGTVNLPPASSAGIMDQLLQQAIAAGEPAPESEADALARGAAKLREAMDGWIETTLKNSPGGKFESLPKAVAAPHLDYSRGWPNYGATWGRLKGLPAPDRVVILGTNHFGFATGVCGCDKGFESPLGTCELDRGLVDALRKELGEEGATRLFENRYDHEREHSIELQVPWIQHAFGASPKVFAALVHDPAANEGESYDGKGLGFEPFVRALRAALEKVGGTTLIVASADLSHVGPAFGDQTRLAGDDKPASDFRNKVFTHDRELLGLFAQGKPDELLASMSWQQNPTRWCSLGNMLAAYQVTQPGNVEVLNYAAAIDPEGYTCVTSASVVMR